MRKEFKGFIVGIVVTIMLMGSVAFAAGVSQKIDVVFNSVNIAVNGEKVAADNILYNGTTYVPLRAVADMFGKDVGWDAATNTALINDKGASTSPAAGYSRTNPAPVGVMQRISVENIFDNYTAEVTVKETIRGQAAWERIKAVNMFNDEPGTDEEYILARIHVKAVQVKDDKSLSINRAYFSLYSESNVKYDSLYSVVAPEPALNTELYSGAEHEGYVVFKVKKTDNNPKIAYGLKYDGTGGIWFKLQ